MDWGDSLVAVFVVVFVGPFVVYLYSRLASAAWYRSKEEALSNIIHNHTKKRKDHPKEGQ